MKRTLLGFTILGMKVRVKGSALLCFLIVWLVLALLTSLLFNFSFALAVGGGAVAALMHWVAVLVHHYGHYRAALSTGYPLKVVIVAWLLAIDIYPRKEKGITATQHKIRAKGGPIASLIFGLVVGLISIPLYFTVGEILWPLYFLALNSLFVFGLGSFVPLDAIGLETDGSTLLKYRGQA